MNKEIFDLEGPTLSEAQSSEPSLSSIVWDYYHKNGFDNEDAGNLAEEYMEKWSKKYADFKA